MAEHEAVDGGCVMPEVLVRGPDRVGLKSKAEARPCDRLYLLSGVSWRVSGRMPRMRRTISPFAAATILVTAGLAVGCSDARPGNALFDQSSAGAATGFNLLLITLDTTRADHLGCYGGPEGATPNLDRLAAEGVRFDCAMCTAPVTLPSHASILTGLYPPNHGVRNNGEILGQTAGRSIAEVLAARGYETAAFVSAFVLDARFGLDRGFETYDDRVSATGGSTFAVGTNERPADHVVDAAVQWLRTRSPDAPFFLWVHLFDPHAPYEPPAEFRGRFPDRPYLGEVSFMDSQVGRLLEELAVTAGAENSLVVAVGDHGESLGDHAERTHSIFIYDAVMRVPMIIWSPKLFPAPSVVADLVSTVDLSPTVLELMGATEGSVTDGVSAVGSAPDAARWVYMESMVPFLDYGWAPLTGLRRMGDKLIRAPRPEYYDLVADPRESTNLAPDTGSFAGQKQLELESTLDALRDRWPGLELDAEEIDMIDGETAARLQALGYFVSTQRPASTASMADPKDRIQLQNAIIDANELLSRGDASKALVAIQDAAARAPGEPSVLFVMAKIFLRMGRIAEAEVALRRSVEARPKAETLLLLAQIEVVAGRHAVALELLDRASELDPAHGGVLIVRGDILLAQGLRAEAIATYLRAAELDPYRAAGAARARAEAARQ